MIVTRQGLIDLINVLSIALENLNDDQFNNLINQNGNLIYLDKDPVKSIFEVSVINFENILKALNCYNNREEALSFLEKQKMKKDDLLKLGKHTGANVITRDTKQKMLEKIVEATVGSRLRSEAIMNIDLSKNLKKR